MQVVAKKKKAEWLLLPAWQVLLETYLPVELINGNAVVPRDVFLTMCLKKLNNN